MALVIKGSSSGQITLDVPAAAGTNTLTIPASTGTVALTSDITSVSGAFTPQADLFRLTAAVTSDSGGISSNWERPDDTAGGISVVGKVGTGMTESSGVFKFPATGIYLVSSMVLIQPTNDSDNVLWLTYVSGDNGSNYDSAAQCLGSDPNTTVYSQCLVDCTNTTNTCVKFGVISLASGGSIAGNTDSNETCVSFIKVGET